MKVLVISHMYPSTVNEVAGIFVHKQKIALQGEGVQLRVVSPIPWAPFPLKHMGAKWRSYAQVPKYVLCEGVPVYFPRYLAFPRNWFFFTAGWRMYAGMNACIQQVYREFPFDIIHAHVALPDGYAAALSARAMQTPLILTIHGQDLQRTVDISAACRYAVGLALQMADHVVFVSHKLYRLAADHFGARPTWSVIANGIDQRDIFKDAGLSAGAGRKLLSVGNLVQTKGVHLNLQALKRLVPVYNDLQYDIIGAGPEEQNLRRIVQELGLQHHVHFRGQLDHATVMKYMAECDIFVLPSYSEGFGVVYLEAMMHGKPVIACHGEGIQDVITDRVQGLLVKPKSVEELTEAIQFLLERPAEAQHIGARARHLVLRDYTWEKNAEQMCALYQHVLNRAH